MGGKRLVVHLIVKLVVLVSLVGNFYLIGLVRHSPNSYGQLKAGGTAAYPGLITRASASQLSVQVTDDKGKKSTKRVALKSDTPYAIFPKNYQTLVPIGLPSSAADIVVGTTEASVSAQLPYLKAPQALRVNLVRDDMLTGKVIEAKSDQITFKGYAAAGYADETRSFAAGLTYQKLGTDGTLSSINQADVKKDMGLYAYLDGVAENKDAKITKLIVADFTATTE
jgi:hypothetical protein